jgi:Signal transduction histidine kinase
VSRSTFIQSGELVTILGGKIFRSLRLRLFLLMLLFGMLPCFVLRTLILRNYEDRAVAVRIAEIQNQCTILSNQLSKSDYFANSAQQLALVELSQLSTIYGGRIMLIDNHFRIVHDTYQLDEGKTMVSEDVIRCYQESGTSYYDAKSRYIEITVPIMDVANEYTRGVMLMSISTDNIVDNVEVLSDTSMTILLTIFAILIAASYLLAFLIVRPFSRITQSIAGIAGGHDSEKLGKEAYTETEQMAEAFNKMLSRFKVLDESRQEFVSNVSHELRTPITSMKVLADSLLSQEDVPIEMYQEFMLDMSQEIEREDKIINELLTLVKMDKTAMNLNIKSESINDVLERSLKRLRPIAALQNIELIFESHRAVVAEIDRVLLSLAVSNLIENAIKYNRVEGHVHVSLDADYKVFKIVIEDSGIGIAEDEQEHIFERFYRVDKSHSREIGGTGLGLAITRNAIAMHKGTITVQSEEGEGTTFIVQVPLNYVVK